MSCLILGEVYRGIIHFAIVFIAVCPHVLMINVFNVYMILVAIN